MNIEKVCKKLLDNADVVMDFSSFPKLTLTFGVIGKVDSKFWEVVFILESVCELSIEREHQAEFTSKDSYMVLEAQVSSIEQEGFEVHTVYFGDGCDLSFLAKTVGFKWNVISFNEEEFKNKYNYMFADIKD